MLYRFLPVHVNPADPIFLSGNGEAYTEWKIETNCGGGNEFN